jgi:hypothetical protein
MKLLALATLATLMGAMPACAFSYMDPVDGKWDCSSHGGVTLGTLEITGATYAFTKRDGTAANPGELRRDEYYDNPTFFILSGHLKDIGYVIAAVKDLPVGIEYPLYLADGNGNKGSCLRTRN